MFSHIICKQIIDYEEILYTKSPQSMAVLKNIIAGLRSENEEIENKLRDVRNAHFVRGYEMYCLEQRVLELEKENNILLIQIVERGHDAEVTQMTLEFTVECFKEQIFNFRM